MGLGISGSVWVLAITIWLMEILLIGFVLAPYGYLGAMPLQIYMNNVIIGLLGAIPIVGVAWAAFIIYNTGQALYFITAGLFPVKPVFLMVFAMEKFAMALILYGNLRLTFRTFKGIVDGCDLREMLSLIVLAASVLFVSAWLEYIAIIVRIWH